jgi:hypothetical protein
MVVGALPVGLGSGCADHENAEAEGAYVSPPGFSPQHTKAATLSGFAFARDASQQIVSNTVLSRREVRQAKGLSDVAKSDAISDELKLEATFHGTYADGMSVAVSRQPNAWLKVKPQGAQPAKSRVRGDGSLVSFEEAFPKVTSAFGANERKVEEFLVIQNEADAPTLAYDLEPGPDFDHLEEGEGRLWAFAHDGSGLFTINPPFADDAAGKHVEGEWQLTAKPAGGYTITAKINLRGLQYPVLLDPTFETPSWFKSETGQPTGRAAGAAAFDISHNCTVLFGGAGSGFSLLNDTAVRCGDQKWATITASGAPTARAYGAAAWSGASNTVNVFGGYTNTVATDELWKLSLSCGGTSASCTGTWTQVTKSGSWPEARYMHGAAWTGSKLVIFGGVNAAGTGLTDTWEWDGSTWTQVCTGCFVNPTGLYGFASGVTVNGGTRTVYAMGGYNQPTGSGGTFVNDVYRYTGGGWTSVNGAAAVQPVSDQGVLTNGQPTTPAGRYLHWISGTDNNNLLMGSGLTTSTSGVDTAIIDTWLWVDRTTDGYENQWLRAPRPTATPLAPGSRESANVVFDESLRQVVLFGGLDVASGSPVTGGRVYKGVGRSISLSQTCADLNGDGLCDNSTYDLTVTFNNVTTSAECTNLQAIFTKYDGNTGQWNNAAATATASLNAGICTATKSLAIDNTVISDLGVRVRDNRYHTAGTTCSNVAGDIAVSGKAACLPTGGFDGSASCGSLADPFVQPTVDCQFY